MMIFPQFGAKRRNSPQNATIRPKMPQNAAKRRKTPQNAAKRRKTPQNAAIRPKNKYMTNHCSTEEEWGGRSYYKIGIWVQLAGLGIIFRTSQKIFFEGDSKTTNLVVAKSYEKPKIIVRYQT